MTIESSKPSPAMPSTAKLGPSQIGPNVPDSDTERLNAARAAARARRAQREESPRSRNEDFGGMRLKMSVQGSIPGYHLYWENDDDGAIEQLLFEGFDFVSQEEVHRQEAIVADADLGDRISRYVGKKADGSALRAYLMKCTDEVWESRERHRYDQADKWDADIRRVAEGHGDGMRKLKNHDTSIDTKFRKEY
jgi:hypothetical protein